jgi:hypothetical protein
MAEEEVKDQEGGTQPPAPPPTDKEAEKARKKREKEEAKRAGEVQGQQPQAGLKEMPQEKANPLAGLTEGRMVHYCTLLGDDGQPTHRPAIVVRVISAKKGQVDLVVFTAKVDYPKNQHPGHMMFVEGALFSAEPQKGTWHFPERV